MTLVKEEKKIRGFRLTDSEMELIDELLDIENDKRMTIAKEHDLVFKPLNRTSFLISLINEKKRHYEKLGEM
ncbi:hypothetical protein [Bacillus cereus]|uniref:hypothetical protein n=1 Tax=Bacillus cereus TaxID=1396 RepID=UPI002D767543|nr:hypothetical protein [Bacillus cereus]